MRWPPGSGRSRACAVRRTGPWRIQETVEAMFDKARTPLADGLRRDPLARGDDLVVCAIDTAQDNARTQRECLRRLAAQRQRLELLSLGIAQHKLRLWSSAHPNLAVRLRYTTDSNDAF